LRQFLEETNDNKGFKIESVHRNFQRQNNLTVKFYGPGEFFDAQLVAPQKIVQNVFGPKITFSADLSGKSRVKMAKIKTWARPKTW